MSKDNLIQLKIPKVDCLHCRLSGICAAGNLGDDEAKQIDKAIIHMNPLKRGDYLFRQGDNFESLYIIRSGTIKSFISSEDGEEQIVGFNFPGELLGLDAFDNGHHATSTKTLELVSLCKLSKQNFDRLSQHCAHFHTQCLRVFSKELIHIQQTVMVMGQKDTEEKLACFLLGISARMKERGFSDKEFNLTMSRSEIANFLGIASETVSRLLTKLHDSGIIQVERRMIRIQSMDSLTAMSV
ncbi:MAG: cyclic nucleotide-binding domain-containing protein [Gammaproteobacteria bacterium]